MTKNIYLSADNCIGIIEMLSHSQGFYARLLSAICEDEENYHSFCEFCENGRFRDDLDLIMALEG